VKYGAAFDFSRPRLLKQISLGHLSAVCGAEHQETVEDPFGESDRNLGRGGAAQEGRQEEQAGAGPDARRGYSMVNRTPPSMIPAARA